jgi:hypothetical protein
MQIPLQFQTAGPFNLGGGEIIFIVYLSFFGFGFWLLSKLVGAIVRISHALESASRSLEIIADNQARRP